MLCKTFASTLKSRQRSCPEPWESFAPQSFAGKHVARLQRLRMSVFFLNHGQN